MEKTSQEITAAVLAYCERLCPDTYKPYIDDDGCVSIWRKLKWNLEPYFEVTVGNETTVLGIDATNWRLFYRLLGLDKRDALEAERGKSAKLIEAAIPVITTMVAVSQEGMPYDQHVDAVVALNKVLESIHEGKPCEDD